MTIPSAGEDAEQLELSCIDDGTALWKKVGQLLMKLLIHLPYDPATPLLEMKTYVHMKTCT